MPVSLQGKPARAVAKPTGFCIARHHIFVNSNMTFWLATLQPPQAALRPEMAALPHDCQQCVISFAPVPGRRGRRPLLWGKARYNFYLGYLANTPAWSGDHALQIGKEYCNSFGLEYGKGSRDAAHYNRAVYIMNFTCAIWQSFRRGRVTPPYFAFNVCGKP